MTLPPGFRVRLDPQTKVTGSGRTLIGGSPVRVLRLRENLPALRERQCLEVTDAATAVLADRLLAAGLANPVLDEQAGPLRDVTVVIPVRDRSASLERLLSGLTGVPVLVIDDGSVHPEATAEVVARHDARLIALPVNVGPAGARNVGLTSVATPFVAFVDSDVVIAPETLRALAGHFADPAVAAVAPRIRTMPGDPSPSAHWDEEAPSLDRGARSGIVRPWSAISWVPSACLVVRRSAVGAGFAAEHRVAEDVDLVWRLVQGGHRVRYDAQQVAYHDVPATRRAWLARRAFYGTGGAWLCSAHGGWAAPAVLTPVAAVVAGALLAQRRWSVPVIVGAVVLTRVRLGRSLRQVDDGARIAWALTGHSMISTLSQVKALLLRHWWPGVAVAAVGSRRVRRAVLAATVIDLVESRDRLGRNALAGFAIRRLDDLAYGVGLWTGATRQRSARVLLPHLTGLPHRRGRAARSRD